MVSKVTSGKALPDEVLRQIIEKTDGVPLFAEELTKTVLESGVVRGTVGPLCISGSAIGDGHTRDFA